MDKYDVGCDVWGVIHKGETECIFFWLGAGVILVTASEVEMLAVIAKGTGKETSSVSLIVIRVVGILSAVLDWGVVG